VIIGVVLVGLVVGGLWYWKVTHGIESTDDAYTDGRAVVLAPVVSGHVKQLLVDDNQFLHKGDPILRIDPRDYQSALDQALGQQEAVEGQIASTQHALEVARVSFPARYAEAEATLLSAQAMLAKAQADNRRQHNLPHQATTQEQVDSTEAAQRSAAAQVEVDQAALQAATPVKPNIEQIAAQVKQLEGTRLQMQAMVDLAKLNLERCILRAPQDGWVTKRAVEVGNYVSTGQQVASLVSPQVWVTANFKESQLRHMRPGQNVRISVDAYPQLHLIGHVDSVQLGSGNKFTAFPPENATGNFVKIVQRIPVKIVIDSGLDPQIPLPLGLSVEPDVEVQ